MEKANMSIYIWKQSKRSEISNGIVARYAAKECDVKQDLQKSGCTRIDKMRIAINLKISIVVRPLTKEKATTVAIKTQQSYIVYIIIEYIINHVKAILPLISPFCDSFLVNKYCLPLISPFSDSFLITVSV